MKFEIEMKDFWLDEESEIEAALKSYVIHEVVTTIQKSIKEKVEQQITKRVNEVIEDRLKSAIDAKMDDLLLTETIIISGKEIPIREHVKSRFQNSTGWNSPYATLDKLAKQFGDEMKRQYNAAFANQIVVKMKEQGFLKDDVVNILLDGNKQ